MDSLLHAFADSSFAPHGYCIAWEPRLLALQVGSDALIAFAYFAIPLSLLFLVHRRTATEHSGLFHQFAAFIAACGMTHVMAVYTMWQPAYWSEGWIKAGTAAISLAAAVQLWRVTPRLLALPSPTQLARVNAQLQAEVEERRQAERRFSQLVELAPNAILLVDDEGRITLANSQAERWFGYPRAGLVGQPVDMLVPERFRERHPEQRAQYNAAPRVRPMGTGRELAVRCRDGSELPVDISLGPLETPEGPQTIAVVSDIRERKRQEAALQHANAELQQVNQELQSFAYAVSHDLRQPLRGMSGLARIILEDYGPQLDATGREYAERIVAEAGRMGTLIDGLLALSRITRHELTRETVDLSALAEEVLRDLRAAEPQRAVATEVEPGLMASGDPRLLRAVLENLLGNAWKFTAGATEAHVSFGTTQTDTGPAFVVRDNGAGFDPAYADKLFTPFQRLHQATEFPGNGIGLATAQRIVHRHGGRIRAEGAVGRGAAFYFTLAAEAPDDGGTAAANDG